jgi:hypothetical protein
MIENVFLMYGATPIVAEWLSSFKEFPPRCKPASFSIDLIMQKMMPTDGAAVPPKQTEKEEPKKSKAEIAAAHN